MNGHFEVNNNAYPIGPLRVGEGYKVTDMRAPKTLHSHSITNEQASSIAAKINEEIREGAPYLKADQEQSLIGAVAIQLIERKLPI